MLIAYGMLDLYTFMSPHYHDPSRRAFREERSRLDKVLK